MKVNRFNNIERAVQNCVLSISRAISCSEEKAEWIARNAPLLVDESGEIVFPEHISHPQGVCYEVKNGFWLRLHWDEVENGNCIDAEFDYHKNLLSLIEKTGISDWKFRDDTLR